MRDEIATPVGIDLIDERPAAGEVLRSLPISRFETRDPPHMSRAEALKDGSPSAGVVGAEGHVLPGLDLSPLHVELHANAS